jgi:hypothetical protein
MTISLPGANTLLIDLSVLLIASGRGPNGVEKRNGAFFRLLGVG